MYFEFGTVEIEGHPENTAEYIQGDGTLKTIRCRTCGCVTHWEPLEPKPGARHGVHLGNFDPELIASVRARKFDGVLGVPFDLDRAELEVDPRSPDATTQRAVARRRHGGRGRELQLDGAAVAGTMMHGGTLSDGLP